VNVGARIDVLDNEALLVPGVALKLHVDVVESPSASLQLPDSCTSCPMTTL